MLYLLYNHNLIRFTRKKDKQKGWYIYYWTLLPESIKFNYFKRKRDLLERLKERVEEENQELFFICPNNCTRLNFDQAMDFEFHCPECGELISQDDNRERIKNLQKKIVETEKELEHLRKQTIRRKVVKAKKKEVKAKKKVKKAAKKKKPVKKKVVKKTKKKPVKKKVVKKKGTKKKTIKKKAAKNKPVKKKVVKKKTVKKSIKRKKK